MLTFLSAKRDSNTPHTTSSFYEVLHVTPGRQGTHLSLKLKLETAFGKTSAEFTDLKPEVEGDDPELALDKLAEWMERAAKAIRTRGAPQRLVASYPDASDD